MKTQKIGLALSCGGARGIAHIGVLKALEEFRLRPSFISGTSSGAMIGAFYAAGYSAKEMGEIVRSNSVFHLSDLSWSTSGLLKSRSNEKMFRKYLGNLDFKSLKIPLLISAVDIMAGKPVVFSSGDVVKAVLASSAIPLLFQPVQFRNRSFIDGGVVSCLPADLLIHKCPKIIGVYVNPVNKTKRELGMLDVFDRGFHLSLKQEAKRQQGYCDIYIEPPLLNEYSMFDFKKADELIDIGYNYTKRFKKQLLKQD